ncbi:MAG: UTRA domain-containing protein [Cypionkella sp.]|nr:UTRA domain-containing protein [Cypionkella sp.]
MTAGNPKGWGEIRVEVLRRIRERIWPPGELIPSEEALAVEFCCARATVNRALRELAEAGVLERRRKAGTRVTALPIRKATLDIPVIRQEVEARGEVHSFRLLQQVTGAPPVPVTARLGLPAGAKLLYVETLHLANNAPFVHETRWLNPAAIEAELPSFATISANEWLVAHVTYHSGNIAFSAAPARPREAAVLGVKMGTALFITERETWTATAPITLVRLAHVPGYKVQTTV